MKQPLLMTVHILDPYPKNGQGRCLKRKWRRYTLAAPKEVPKGGGACAMGRVGTRNLGETMACGGLGRSEKRLQDDHVVWGAVSVQAVSIFKKNEHQLRGLNPCPLRTYFDMPGHFYP